MMEIDFKAFSFLQEKVRKSGTDPVCRLEMPEGSRVRDLILKIGLKAEDICLNFLEFSKIIFHIYIYCLDGTIK